MKQFLKKLLEELRKDFCMNFERNYPKKELSRENLFGKNRKKNPGGIHRKNTKGIFELVLKCMHTFLKKMSKKFLKVMPDSGAF